jgi:hypothetical protein
MANHPREDETNAQRVDENFRRAGEKTAEQTKQIG